MAVTLRKGSGDWSSATHLLKADVEEFALGLTHSDPEALRQWQRPVHYKVFDTFKTNTRAWLVHLFLRARSRLRVSCCAAPSKLTCLHDI